MLGRTKSEVRPLIFGVFEFRALEENVRFGMVRSSVFQIFAWLWHVFLAELFLKFGLLGVYSSFSLEENLRFKIVRSSVFQIFDKVRRVYN